VELPPPPIAELPKKRKYVRRKPLEPRKPKDTTCKTTTTSTTPPPRPTPPSDDDQPYKRPYQQRKRKRPPPVETELSSPSPSIAESVEIPDTSTKDVTPTIPQELPPSPPPPPLDVDPAGTLLPHSVRVVPILPPTSTHEKNNQEKELSVKLELKYPQVYGNGLGKAPPIDKPQWKSLYTPDIYFDQDYTTNENNDQHDKFRRLDPQLHPVTRDVTCVATRRPDLSYMAVGDSAGFVSIYSLGPHIRPVARLETLACQQRAYAQQEKIRDVLRRKKKLRSITHDTTQTSIHALALVGSRVVLATACELECMDIPSQTSLWVCPLAQDRIVTSLDMHPHTFDVLVSCSLQDNRDPATPTSPLMLLKHSQNNVEICDANTPVLVKSPCCTAIWDCSKTTENRLLFITPDNQELELVLVQGGSIDNWKVACKTRIPYKQSNLTSLRQSAQGTYTLVASSRGIRLYQTETLQLIHVYGDQLALHGKSIVWQDCLFLGNNKSARNKPSKSQNNGVLEYDDFLVEDDDDGNLDSATDLGQYIVGVPHPKGPKELCETLHVWNVEHATTVPALSIPLPPKSEGVQNLVSTSLTHDRLVLATSAGVSFEKLPSFASDFAGIMYPAGYQVIHDNLEYLEDEDELDHVVPIGDDDPHGTKRRQKHGRALHDENSDDDDDSDHQSSVSIVDDDLKEAMRRSILEQKRQPDPQDQDVVVVDMYENESDDDGEPRPIILPCRPEAYLQQALNNQDDDDDDEEVPMEESTTTSNDPEQSQQQDCNLVKLLQSMPHANQVKNKESTVAAAAASCGFEVTVKTLVVVNAIKTTARNKRSRQANLEAMLKASIDTNLQRWMKSKQSVGANGSGSTLRPAPIEDDNDEEQKLADENDAEVNANTNPKSPSMKLEPAYQYVTPLTEPPVVGPNGDEQTMEHVHVEASQTTVMEINGHRYDEHESSAADDKQPAFAMQAQNSETSFDIASQPEKVESTNPVISNWADCETPNHTLNADRTTDEAAVIMGLLGLSPFNAIPVDHHPSPTPVPAPVMPTPASSNTNVGQLTFAAIQSQAANNNNGYSDTSCMMYHTPGYANMYGTGEATAGSSDRGSADDETSSEVNGVTNRQHLSPINEGPQERPKCLACRGRMVIHSCGKRSLPIDFDEVVRAERDRKEAEEEEKKKARAEKRRMADARRREVRKQKQREKEERRRWEEEKLRLEKERLLRLESESFERTSQLVVRRQEVLAAAQALEEQSYERTPLAYSEQSYANNDYSQHQQVTYTQAAQITTQQPLLQSVDYNQRSAYTTNAIQEPDLASAALSEARPWHATSAASAALSEARPWHATSAASAALSEARPWHATSAVLDSYDFGAHNGAANATPALYDSQERSADFSGAAFAKPKSAIGRDASMGTLSSAEALAALAGFASAPPKAVEPSYSETAEAGHAEQSQSSYARASFSASVSHGFTSSEGVPTSFAASVSEEKRRIPTYASIRGQSNGDVGYFSYEAGSKPANGDAVTRNGEESYRSADVNVGWAATNGVKAATQGPQNDHYISFGRP
jgi:hypothetical protein